METLLDRHWHRLQAEKVIELMGSHGEKGLDQFQSDKRFQHFGENLIVGKKPRSGFERFLLQFHQPLVYILLSAGGVTAVLGEWVDAGVILAVVVVNSLIGFLQEAKAEKALSSLTSAMRVQATVVRAGETIVLDAAALVPGDIVLLRSGDKVPADVRILLGKELRIDESTLTGESVPVEKNAVAVDRDAVLAERSCMGYAGTLVSYGQGTGVVVATGNKTEIGRISGLIDSAKSLETPLTRQITKFSHILLIAILILASASFIFGVLQGEPASEMFMAAVALAVGAIPEGLPAAVTIILALGVSRMAGRKAIIRKLPAVETLGGTTVICSDKTGTLTKNQMTVQQIYSAGIVYNVSGTGYSLEGNIAGAEDDADASSKSLAACLRAGMLCNDARISGMPDSPVVEGDPTEAALLVSAAKYGLNLAEENADSPRIDELPFESDLQYMVTFHQAGGEIVAYMKGSVERVVACCEDMMVADGNTAPLDADEIMSRQDQLASRGLRVLAFAVKTLPKSDAYAQSDVQDRMTFVGLQGMIDPPREEARIAVEACQQAGISVKMITGDHAVTAQAIGSKLGLVGNNCTLGADCPVMTGWEIEELTDEELIGRVDEIPVFARVSPHQKLRLVMALQARGEVCAMTGDGVNDAPALKQADIGIAMGVNGTEAAKEAADMVLTDDNFSTIEAAVEEGRCVFSNLVKFIAWTLPTNAGEGLVILTAILFGVTLPILPVQILWINMTTALCLGMMLAFEPMEPGLMDRKPRRPDQPILGGLIIKRIAMVSLILLVAAFGLYEWEIQTGADIAKARTMAVNVFVVVEAFYLFNSRSFERSPFALGIMSNPLVPIGFVAMMILQLLYTYVPVMNALFSSAPLDVLDWAKILTCGFVAFAVIELDKKRVRGRKAQDN
ncbi:cation-transporting P-type ATPase [Desulfovibrio ferrophilus]|uniref:HAD superfamily P-type ATPase n=1 Tax=Desulfovibrio ferrophilus TaxID=241368 RepID=A0A2Z6AYH4_9BACT|nr:cation-transporting P-type ATPase [Desulfovibrio ferrophilus]BBD08299.1 HAD superfamily P-type ATPase [Desulfovibrio ferrophilus]